MLRIVTQTPNHCSPTRRIIMQMKKLIVITLAAVGGAAVYKLLNSDYRPPAKP